MQREFQVCMVVIMVVVSGSGCTQDAPQPAPMFGISHASRWNLDSLYPWEGHLTGPERLTRLGVDLNRLDAPWYRPNFNWAEALPELVLELSSVEQVTEAMIEDAARGAVGSGFDWTTFDLILDTMQAQQVEVIAVIANSDDWRLPRLPGTDASANPDALGQAAYLAQLSLYTRAVVRRYRDRVQLWQIDNELNAASFTRLVPTGRKGFEWEDNAFLDDIIVTMAEAVRAEDSAAIVMTNFHTDIFDWVHEWRDTLVRWEPYLDWIGLDSYQNFLEADPLHWQRVGEIIDQTRALVPHGKPVIVLETGYPSRPNDKGYNEQKQAEYLAKAARIAVEHKARGFFIYTITTPEDLGGFGEGQSAENYWGLIDQDGTDKPAFDALAGVIAELQ